MHRGHIGIERMNHQRDATGREAPVRFCGTWDLADELRRESAPDVAHVHPGLFEDITPHDPHVAATLKAMLGWPLPRALLEAARGLERFEHRADPILQAERKGV